VVAVLKQRPLNLLPLMAGSMLLRNLKSQAIFDKANAELAFIRTNEINVAHFQGENYPERLKHCIDGPFYYLLLDKLI
jgi:DNA processing protein